MALLIKVKEENGKQSRLPIWIPDRAAYERHLEAVNKRLAADMKEMEERRSAGYKEDERRRAKDTKPDFIVDKSVPGRTVIVVGAGQEWNEDLKDLARRTLEKPDPRKNPKLSHRDTIMNDYDTAMWLGKRYPTRKRNFQISIK